VVVTAVNGAAHACYKQREFVLKRKPPPPARPAPAAAPVPMKPAETPKYGRLIVKRVRAGDYKVKITPALPGQDELNGSTLLDKATPFERVLVTKEPYVIEWEYLAFDPPPIKGTISVMIQEGQTKEITIPPQ
jgi:hypothetical protein